MDASTLHPECTLGRQTPVCRQLGHEAAFRADQGLRTRHGHRRLGNVVLSASLSGGRQWPTTVCCGHLSQMDTPLQVKLVCTVRVQHWLTKCFRNPSSQSGRQKLATAHQEPGTDCLKVAGTERAQHAVEVLGGRSQDGGAVRPQLCEDLADFKKSVDFELTRDTKHSVRKVTALLPIHHHRPLLPKAHTRVPSSPLPIGKEKVLFIAGTQQVCGLSRRARRYTPNAALGIDAGCHPVVEGCQPEVRLAADGNLRQVVKGTNLARTNARFFKPPSVVRNVAPGVLYQPPQAVFLVSANYSGFGGRTAPESLPSTQQVTRHQ